MSKIVEKTLYKKVGKGSFRDKNGRIRKPNETFLAYPQDIPDAFKDVVIRVDGGKVSNITLEKEEKRVSRSAIVPTYTLEETQRKGYFNIVNQDGQKMNEKPLSKVKAQSLIDDLNAE